MKFLLYCCVAGILHTACNRKMTTDTSTAGLENNTEATATIVADTAIPACIRQKIEDIKKQRVWNPPAQINLYEYEGRKVYEISADCCDQFTTLVDENCTYICAPSGGFTGKGDRKCIDFYDKARHLSLVWQDERSRTQQSKPAAGK